MTNRPAPDRPDSDLRNPDLGRAVARLQDKVFELEAERDRYVRQRRRQLLLMGVALSLLAHISLMIVLNLVYRPARGGGAAPGPVSYEFAILQEEQLTDLESTEFEDINPEEISEVEEEISELEPTEFSGDVSAPELEIAAAGAMSTLGGAGSGDGGMPGLGGGGAGTSFFGISSEGSRFAYIVDISGSMGQGRKMATAMRELGRSIASLPDYAHFYVVLYNSSAMVPPMQRGWTRARRSATRSLIQFLEQEVTPGRGTDPKPAFQVVFSLDVRPDVIFFLTDGEIATMSASFVAALNNRGRPVIINTIAFGDPSSQELLKQIAFESDGTYRFVPSR
ncbi:MAG: vWA domain-containing protein [Planctomycetota bacterium]|jgi:hypothetical protein